MTSKKTVKNQNILDDVILLAKLSSFRKFAGFLNKNIEIYFRNLLFDFIEYLDLRAISNVLT
jgi:hypothetical protein